jgi:hypothetical protein
MEGAEQRRPKDEELGPLLDLIWEGNSLRGACLKLGLHVPSTSDWLHSDDDRREQYARAREGRAEFLQEDALAMNRAAATGAAQNGKKIDPSGARGYLEAAKWATARMAPKTAPVKRHEIAYLNLSPSERRARMAEIEAQLATEGEAEGGLDEE